MHIFLKPPLFVACKKCGKQVLPHTLCENCGTYRNREVVDVLAKLTKKEKKQKQKELRAQEAENPQQATPPANGLNPEQLSKP
jgi:large subunit ribosomal protein L32